MLLFAYELKEGEEEGVRMNKKTDTKPEETSQPAEPTRREVEQVNIYNNILKNHPDLAIRSLRLARELILAHTLLMARADEYLRPYDLSWSKLSVLMWLRTYQQEQNSGLAPSILSELVGVGRNTVSTLLEGLEKQGFINRKSDAQDKRRFIIEITAAGTAVVQECLETLGQRLEEILQPFDSSQRELFTTSLIDLQQVLTRPPR